MVSFNDVLELTSSINLARSLSVCQVNNEICFFVGTRDWYRLSLRIYSTSAKASDHACISYSPSRTFDTSPYD